MSTVSGVHVFLVLMKASHSVIHFAAQTSRESELGSSDFRVLEALLHKGPMPVNAIGPKVFLTPGSISLAVDRLFEKGLVTRVDSEEDRRVRVVDLAAQGRKLIKRVFSAHAERLEELMSILNQNERKELTATLKKLGKHAEGASQVNENR